MKKDNQYIVHSIRGRDRARARDRDMDRLGLGLGLGLGSGLYTSTLFSFPGMRFRKCVIAFQFPGSPLCIYVLYVPSTDIGHYVKLEVGHDHMIHVKCN